MQWQKFTLCLIVFVVVMTFCAGPAYARQSSKEPLVKVLLEERAPSVRISGEMEILGYSAPLPFTGEKVFNRENLRVPLRILAQSGHLSVNGDPYRGEIIVKPTSEGLMVVNQLALDEYLYGVLPSEISPTWPMEALKAQAVAARCYALVQIQTRKNADFHLYDDLRSQVYYGVRKESARTTEAVDKTRGVVAVHNGEIIQAYFFAAAGGKTANSEDVWGTKLPYLKSVSDFDETSPYNDWKVKFTLQELRKQLETNGFDIGMPTQLVVLERDSTNRVQKVQIIGDAGEVTLSGSKLRFILNLKSTSFSIAGVAAVERLNVPSSDEKAPVAAATVSTQVGQSVGTSGVQSVSTASVGQNVATSANGGAQNTVDSPALEGQILGALPSYIGENAHNPESTQSSPAVASESETVSAVLEELLSGIADVTPGMTVVAQVAELSESDLLETEGGMLVNEDGTQTTNSNSLVPTAPTTSTVPATAPTPTVPTTPVVSTTPIVPATVVSPTPTTTSTVSTTTATPPMTGIKTADPMVLEFIGSGYGHGVGMSQWGAKELALKGADYKKILLHYYQGVQIIRLYE